MSCMGDAASAGAPTQRRPRKAPSAAAIGPLHSPGSPCCRAWGRSRPSWGPQAPQGSRRAPRPRACGLRTRTDRQQRRASVAVLSASGNLLAWDATGHTQTCQARCGRTDAGRTGKTFLQRSLDGLGCRGAEESLGETDPPPIPVHTNNDFPKNCPLQAVQPVHALFDVSCLCMQAECDSVAWLSRQESRQVKPLRTTKMSLSAYRFLDNSSTFRGCAVQVSRAEPCQAQKASHSRTNM